MRLRPDGTFERTDIWREGEWLDLWSVVHFLSGLSIGLGLYLLGFTAIAATVIAFLMMVAYELWEAVVEIEETPANRVMDVVVGMISFGPAFFFLPTWFTTDQLPLVFGVILMVNLILSAIGWMASRKAAVLENKLRLEYQAQRGRLGRRFGRLRRRVRYHTRADGSKDKEVTSSSSF